MNPVTIERMQVNPTKVLTSDSKKALVNIIDHEFNNQSTIYNANAEVEREKLMEQYRKAVGFNVVKAQHIKAERAVETAQHLVQELEKKMNLLGLDDEGERYRIPHSEKRPEVIQAQEKLSKLLEAVEAQSPSNVRNKIIARLWLAETHGEACVILNQVLGNGIIPQMTEQSLLIAPPAKA